MRSFNLLYLLLLLLLLTAAATSVRGRPDFLNLRRKYQHRRHCLYRRCLPLHSRVPFP